MCQSVQSDRMSRGDDAAQKVRMPARLVPQAEPGGRGVQIRTKFEGSLRGQWQPAFEAIQGFRMIIGRAAELEPVLPV